MFVRRRPLMRAAVVGGGAYMAGRHVANKQAEQQSYEAEQDARLSSLEQQQQTGGYPPAAPPPAPEPPAAAPAAGPSMMDQLNQLNDLHKQGVLSDDEFTAAKAKLLS
jgi:putative oligomerization/nucleic acid binding protein